MRLIRDHESLDRDEQLGILEIRRLIPRLSRRRGPFRLSPARLHHPRSLGYIAWLAFLIFWIVFGRLTLFWFMTTGGFYPYPYGLELRLANTHLSGAEVDALLSGDDVLRPDGSIELNRTYYRYFHLRVGMAGQMTLENEEGLQSELHAICDDHADSGKHPVVFITLPEDSPYQNAVSAVDLLSSAQLRCTPFLILASRES